MGLVCFSLYILHARAHTCISSWLPVDIYCSAVVSMGVCCLGFKELGDLALCDVRFRHSFNELAIRP